MTDTIRAAGRWAWRRLACALAAAALAATLLTGCTPNEGDNVLDLGLPADYTGCQVARHVEVEVQNAAVTIGAAIADEFETDWFSSPPNQLDRPRYANINQSRTEFYFYQGVAFTGTPFLGPEEAPRVVERIVRVLEANGYTVTSAVARPGNDGDPMKNSQVYAHRDAAQVIVQARATTGIGDLRAESARSTAWPEPHIGLYDYLATRDNPECQITEPTALLTKREEETTR